MAPRTKAQQIAYNAKRRAESAAKKTVPVVAPTPRHNLAAQVKREGADSLLPPARKKLAPAKPKRQGHQVKLTAAKKRKAELAVGPAKVSPAVVYAKHHDPRYPDVPRTIISAPEPAPKSLSASAVMDGSPPMHTMARSYVRNGGAGRGKLRGKTYQTTVSFTQEQMAQVVAAAGFRNVSLAEMIRSCVVEHLNKGM